MRKYLALLLGFMVLSVVIRPSSTYTPPFVGKAISRGSNDKQSIFNDSLLANQPIPDGGFDRSVAGPITKGRYKVIVTAFSSTVDQTDNTPFITASGDYVHEGVVAANWLPLGTAIRIPELFGNKVFIVEDRMATRNKDNVDVWFPEKNQAVNFGAKYVNVEVL